MLQYALYCSYIYFRRLLYRMCIKWNLGGWSVVVKGKGIHRVFHLNSTHTPIMQFDIVFSCYVIYLYLTEKCHSDLCTSRDWNHKQPSFRSIDNNLHIVNCDRRAKLFPVAAPRSKLGQTYFYSPSICIVHYKLTVILFFEPFHIYMYIIIYIFFCPAKKNSYKTRRYAAACVLILSRGCLFIKSILFWQRNDWNEL